MAKAIDDLEFTDDYMFGEVLKNKEICIGVLKIIVRPAFRNKDKRYRVSIDSKVNKSWLRYSWNQTVCY